MAMSERTKGVDTMERAEVLWLAALRANAECWRLYWAGDNGDEYTFWCEQVAALWPLYVATLD